MCAAMVPAAQLSDFLPFGGGMGKISFISVKIGNTMIFNT